MNTPSRSTFLAATMLLMILAIVREGAWAQTPAQMEYERQQREYRQQQERQQQEQQRQQQLMNENARRQQEESRRLNTPTGQNPAPSYQGATPQRTTPQSRPRTEATPETQSAKT